MSDPLDLTGDWSGIYNYPRAMPPNPFIARLIERGGLVSGETSEPSPSDHPDFADATAHGLLDGRRDGHAVRFTKHYDAAHRVDTPVHYHGTLSPDGDEISGDWAIPGHWGGSFIMVRDARRSISVDTRIAATAD